MVRDVKKITIQVMRFHCMIQSWRLVYSEHMQNDTAHGFLKNKQTNLKDVTS